jgi:hypothetical protein
MSEPTPPHGSEPGQPTAGRAETRPFAAPLPPQQPAGAAESASAASIPTGGSTPRRSTLLMGVAAAGLLGVGVVVGVVVGQATAGSAAADTGSATSPTAPEGGQQYGTPPDGGMGGRPGGMGGGRVEVGPPVPGGTDDGTTDDGTTGDDSTT